MKLIRSAIIFMLCICFLHLDVCAEVNYDLLHLTSDEQIELLHKKYYIYDIDGVNYKNVEREIPEDSGIYTYEYDKNIESKLIEACGLDENKAIIVYVHENNTYMVIDKKQSVDYVYIFPDMSVYFCDEQFNLIREENFGGCVWIYDIGYYNGMFYCRFKEMVNKINNPDGTVSIEREMYQYRKHSNAIERDITVKSEDMIKWIETDEMIPKTNGSTIIKDNQISLNGIESLKNVLYETNKGNYIENLGRYIVYKEGSTLYFSNDGIYFIPVTAADDIAADNMKQRSMLNIYLEKENVYVYDLFRIPFDELNTELIKLKDNGNIYVKFNDNILGFDQPPVIEDGRTLVPMRFLFEQMGATVDWNSEFQTATATLDNTSVTFAINNTEAKVNSQPVTMDVPARLVNGKTMVPLRFLSEELGYTVTWDEETRTAIIE